MSKPYDQPGARNAGRGTSTSPILLRFFGCAAEMQGINGDYFTVGDSGDEDIALPTALRRNKATKLRFSRGAESWRVAAVDDRPFYINQQRVVGLQPLNSGDVVRLAPGAAGMQFLVKQQQEVSLARLVAKHGPQRATPAAGAAVVQTIATDTQRPSATPLLNSNTLRSLAAVAAVCLLALLIGFAAGRWLPASVTETHSSEAATGPDPTTQE